MRQRKSWLSILTIPAPYRFCRTISLDVAHQKIYFSLLDVDNGFKSRAVAWANLDGTEYEILFEKTADRQEDVAGDSVLYMPQ